MKDNKTRPPGKHPQTRKFKWLSMLSAFALILQAAALCLPAAASDIADLGVSSQDLTVSDEIPESLSKNAVSGITAGYPCIAHVNTYTFPRYVSIGGNYVGGHYITVLGYDSVSDMLLFADCSYLNNRYGIYLVKCSDLDASANTAIHAYVAIY